MQLLDEAPVLDSEIDSLGHMNVRYYMGRVFRASAFLQLDLGLNSAIPQGAVLRRYDTYSRFRREQFSGALLQVYGGVLELSKAHLRCYFEIRNPDRDELAASFITTSILQNPDNGQRLSFTNESLGFNEKYGVRLPQHGQPRSLTLDPPRTDTTLEELNRRVGHESTPGMMSGRRESVVDAADCDVDGQLREDVDLMFAMHRSQSQQQSSFGPPVMRTDEGHRFSWAMIETRAIVLARPRAGDPLVSIGADVALGERWRQSRRWTFVADSATLIGINDTVGIALDLDERRSIAIPASIRNSIEGNYLPDLL